MLCLSLISFSLRPQSSSSSPLFSSSTHFTIKPFFHSNTIHLRWSSSIVSWCHYCQEPPNDNTSISNQVGILLKRQNKLVTSQHFKRILSNVPKTLEDFLQRNLSVGKFISPDPLIIFWSSKMFFLVHSNIYCWLDFLFSKKCQSLFQDSTIPYLWNPFILRRLHLEKRENEGGRKSYKTYFFYKCVNEGKREEEERERMNVGFKWNLFLYNKFYFLLVRIYTFQKTLESVNFCINTKSNS